MGYRWLFSVSLLLGRLKSTSSVYHYLMVNVESGSVERRDPRVLSLAAKGKNLITCSMTALSVVVKCLPWHTRRGLRGELDVQNSQNFPPAATQLHLPFHFLSFRLLQSHRKVCPIIFWLPPGCTPVPLQEPRDPCGRKVMNHVNGSRHNGRLYTFVQP